MMDGNSQVKNQLEMSRNYHDIKGVDKLRQAAQSGDIGALEEAAKQFESIFVQMLLKSMRKAQDALADKDSPFNSEHVKFYRDMHDQQLAVDLSSGDSFGLAKLIVQQLGPQQEGYTPASIMRLDGNLPSSSDRSQNIEAQDQNGIAADMQSPSKKAAFDSPAEFIKTLFPLAQEVAEKIGLAPQAMIAQAAVETGWGKYMIHNSDGKNSHNLFGIKAGSHWQGDKAAINTLEFKDGVARPEKANFRSYGSFTDSLNDYVSFLQDNPRYRQALNKVDDPQQYFEAIQQAGYATDPNYADKIMSVLRGQVSDVLKSFKPSALGGKL